MLESIGCQKNGKCLERQCNNIRKEKSAENFTHFKTIPSKESTDDCLCYTAPDFNNNSSNTATQRSLNILRLFDKETIFKISKNQPNSEFR